MDYITVDSESIPEFIEERVRISSDEEVDEVGNKGGPFKRVKWYYPGLSGQDAEAVLRSYRIDGSYILRSFFPRRAGVLSATREYALNAWYGERSWQFRVEYLEESGEVKFGLKIYENVKEFETRMLRGYQLSNDRYTIYLKKPIPNYNQPSITKEKHFETRLAHLSRKDKLILTAHQSEQLSYEVHNGYLTKQGHVFKSWKRRWFVLNKKTLTYQKTSKSDEAAINTIYLSTIEKLIEVDHNYKLKYCFTIVRNDGYRLTMSAENETDYKRWIEKLSKIVELNKN